MSPHHMIGNLVGFLLLRISRAADGEFGLDQAAAQEFLHGLISGLLLQRKKRMGGSGRRVAPRGESCAFAFGVLTTDIALG
jgi:hypothetical protein